ncbi:DUF4142 domain-containing protein [Opitutus sp. ER46]|uniref:DUF4142 domain-containing protein n=1 Tax=Opitutus sp. ER46 TaxID=2161864 RepID=UPI0013048F81|nr:DUF4142 domain-containing protein [Opitutus sp. ER46]
MALAAVCAPSAGAQPVAPPTGASTAAAEREAAASSLRPLERDFVLASVSNARTQAELSRLAVSQATASALRDFAQQVAADYSDINRSLETLARRKALPVPLQPVSFSERYRAFAERSGAAFDRAYLLEATTASQHALRLCEDAVRHARDPDVRDLAGRMLPTLREHVNLTTQLLKDL